MIFYTILGFIAASLTTVAFLPQVIKCFRTKETKGLSLPMLLLQSSGNGLWLLYGFLISNIVLIIANAITFGLVFSLVILKLGGKSNAVDK